MAKGKTRSTKSDSAPLQSSAGIMRYFEEERSKFKIPPKSILLFGLAIGILVTALNAYYGLWPS
ncbi:MAG: preprotein translocase subunit Sec61beta [Archaeoglobaceae archaeon]